MKSKIYNKPVFIAGILILGICIFVYVVIYIREKRTIHTRMNRFEDTPTTTFNISTAPTPANKNTTCSNSTDMINVCMNYENCCTGSGVNLNSKCFCSHPFVGECNDAYKACIANVGSSGDTSSCDSTLKGCCAKYSNIDIFSSNFQKPINAMQSSNQLCTVNGLPNIEQRCMELCQTHPDCKAYSLAIGGCTLYDTVNDNSGKSTDNYIYVVKK